MGNEWIEASFLFLPEVSEFDPLPLPCFQMKMLLACQYVPKNMTISCIAQKGITAT